MENFKRKSNTRLIFLFIIFLLLQKNLFSKTKEEWKTRTIYQLLTDRFARTNPDDSSECNLRKYCGGTFRGIINNLDYIIDMGFNAIWISPIVENTNNGYHGYHMKNIYAINPHFGTEADFRNFIEECHKRDIWVMLDVIANHVGLVGTDYSSIYPFNDPSHYHEYCIIEQEDFDHNQYKVENCRLSDLPDLKQENDYVKNTLLNWISDLVKTYKIDGLRIDTVPEVPKWFWKLYSEKAGVFQLGEVFNHRIDYVSDYQNYLDSLLNYPLFYAFKNAFQYNGSMNQFDYILQNIKTNFKDHTILGIFFDNHDNSRFLFNNKSINKFKNVIVFSFLTTGIPIFYYGDEQKFNGGDDPYNREPLWGKMNRNSEIYILVQKLNKLRTSFRLWNMDQIQRYSDDIFYAFTRGNIFAAFTNKDFEFERKIMNHPYENETMLCNIFDENDIIFVENNEFIVNMKEGIFKVFTICGLIEERKNIFTEAYDYLTDIIGFSILNK